MSDDTVKKIELHAERTYPDECCGILLGRSKEDNHSITDCMALDNSQDDNRSRRFLITPDQYRAAEETATRTGRELLGFYHSHPDHPASPSAFDTEAALPWFTYLILSVINGTASTLTAWQLDENRARFLERPVVVEHTSPV